MTERIFNFSAGPAVMPLEVLEEAREDLLSLRGTGIGVLEHSHRGKAFTAVLEETEAAIREVAAIPVNYKVLFIQGGASLQFAMLPMNFVSEGQTADYIVTGAWSKKAIKEAKPFAHTAASSEDRNFCYIPKEYDFSADARYVHFTSNNTIFGTQFASEPDIPDGGTLICDASSDIFSRPIDVSKYGMIYAGAQKNLGPSGMALVIVRDDLIASGNDTAPAMLQYRTYAENRSMFNTPPTFGIYLVGKICQWQLNQGGLTAILERNEAKAAKLYDYLETSSLFSATADADSRSKMNVTFVTGDADTDAGFIKQATAANFDGLKGHRSVGGMRASIYNAFPPEGVDALVDFMKDFEASRG
ncbi:MAG: 3-phosphoserine/phosphohydroxythreonine transaminase [Planctomycetales bacterium]|jgi:phosphoserine aminotransferase